MYVILWSDMVVYLLVLIIAVQLYFIAQDVQLRSNWILACATPLRLCALVLLLTYLLIAFLDSVHFQQVSSVNVRSVLDLVMMPSSVQQETSYSEPFATQLFTPSLVQNEFGGFMWQDVALQYVTGDKLLACVVDGLLWAISIWFSVTVLFILLGRRFANVWWFLRRPWVVGYVVLGVVITLCALGLCLSRHYHIFGTDKIGTDIFYAAIKSIRTGIIIGILSTLISVPFAVLFGALAGYLRGWVDEAIQYLYITLSSVPTVLLISAAMLSLDGLITRNSEVFTLSVDRSDFRLLMLCCILGLSSWTSLCRIVRAEVLKLREQDFILAARVMGLGTAKIIMRHIVPNLMHIILLAFVLDFSGLVLAEAVLSYIGVGVDPEMYSWGNMINAARSELARDPVVWWCLSGAFIMMFSLVLAANIFADGVRATFDPRLN